MPAVGFVLDISLNLDQTINEKISRCVKHYEFKPTYLHYAQNLQNKLPTIKGIRRHLDKNLSSSMIVLADSKNF